MDRILRTSLGLTTPGLCALAIAALLTGPLARGQVASVGSPTSPQTALDILHQLSDEADVIFAGQVMSIRPNDGVVEVEFRVDQAIRGCSVGTPYILREWAGLWTAGNQRYRVGQRLLMLLHAPSAAGMSSPVGGLDGAIPIRQGSATTESVGAAQPPYVDLRWLEARVPRAVVYAAQSARRVGGAARAEVAAAGGSVGVAPIVVMGNGEQSSVPSQQASV